MELDDFKNNRIINNSYNDGTTEGNTSSVDRFVELFKKNIDKQRKTSFLLIAILIMLGIVYLSISGRSGTIEKFGYVLSAAGFLLGAVYIYLRYKPIPDSFYAMPLKSFVYESEKRLIYMRKTDWLIVISLLVILGMGGGIIFVTRLSKYISNTTLLIIIWIVFFIALSIFGTWAGRKDWKKEHGKLLDDLHNLKNTLSGAEEK